MFVGIPVEGTKELTYIIILLFSNDRVGLERLIYTFRSITVSCICECRLSESQRESRRSKGPSSASALIYLVSQWVMKTSELQ